MAEKKKIAMSIQICALLCALLFSPFAFSTPLSIEEKNREAQFSKIPSNHFRKLIMFAALYPNTKQADEALQQAWSLLSTEKSSALHAIPPHFEEIALSCIHLVEPQAICPPSPELSQATTEYINAIGADLPNRKLRGYRAKSLDEVASLEPKEVDLARALLLVEGKESGTLSSIEAALDLLALEIIARIGPNASHQMKISALNTLLFHEMTFRYPPLSEGKAKPSQFSELSSVLSSRRGICLGTSILYLSLAQRLDLLLTVFVPPGHIFLGYEEENYTRVIETTARGIAPPLDSYLGLTLRKVPTQNMLATVGMVAFNRAAEHLHKKEWQKALEQYLLVKKFDKSNSTLTMIALCELLLGNKKRAGELSRELLKHPPDYQLEQDFLLFDLARGTLSPKAAQELIVHTSPKREELPERIEQFEKLVRENPKSAILSLHLASLWTEYGKTKEAIPLIESVALFDESPPSLHYDLSYLYYERFDLAKAHYHAQKALLKAQKNGVVPKPILQLILKIQQESPDSPNL